MATAESDAGMLRGRIAGAQCCGLLLIAAERGLSKRVARSTNESERAFLGRRMHRASAAAPPNITTAPITMPAIAPGGSGAAGVDPESDPPAMQVDDESISQFAEQFTQVKLEPQDVWF